MNFMSTRSDLNVNDPEIVNEIYVTKNKFMDKSEKMRRVLARFFGQSILFEPTNEVWSTKRKHLSASFYKEKLNMMLKKIIEVTHDRLNEIKNTCVEGG